LKRLATPAEVPVSNVVNSLNLQTVLSADIEHKRLFRALTNRAFVDRENARRKPANPRDVCKTRPPP
jgi:hypothetical protein